jgi:putative N6-adenine-specific DNA methylase
MKSTLQPIVISAPLDLIPFVKQEVTALGYPVLWTGESALGTRGAWTDALRMNLWLRTAHHVFFQVGEFVCRNLETLYRSVNGIGWESIVPADGYLSVTATVDHPSIRDHRIVNLTCKDAIVDRIAGARGRRPDSGSQRSGAVIAVFWNRDRCSISIDTSGEPLSRRGYRKIPLNAPMQETLAAGVVAATRFYGGEHFVNPMCGSGTIAIEAALAASGKAPGLLRDNFGFMHTLLYHEPEWRSLCNDAEKKIRSVPYSIIATDNDSAAIDAACRNAAAAGVKNLITFSATEFSATPVPEGGGAVVFNPEYGIRLGDERQLVETYRAIGKYLKQQCRGYRGYIFTGNTKLAGNVGLKSGKKTRFFSGKIECRLYEYDLFAGRRE